MNPQEMLDYSFGLLEGPRLDRAEQEATADPALAERLTRLRLSIDTLVDDGQDYEPPPDLFARTLALVERERRRPTAPELAPVRRGFRWSDVAVAAVVFMAATLAITAPIRRSRALMDQANCAYNLRTVGVGLSKYAATHGHYPQALPDYPNGAWAVLLNDAGSLPEVAMASCPCCGEKVRGDLPDFKRLKELVARSPEAVRQAFGSQYAYHIGYHDGSPFRGAIPDRPPSTIPLASDQPPHEITGRILGGNSPNHGGGGQNVLFSDGHVRWLPHRWLSDSDPDIFLNNAKNAAPGLHANDAVLVPGGFRVPAR